MANFFTEAFQELEHIVWPTDKETRRYLTITVVIIVFMTTLLAILGYIFSNSLISIRAQFPHTTTTTADTPATQEDLNNLYQYLGGQVTTSGETASGDITTAVTSSGLTITATNTGETETGATEVQ